MGEVRMPFAVRQAVERLRQGFGLDDQVSLTELRNAGWKQLLERKGKLRLADRKTSVGVIVSSQLWADIQALTEYTVQLEEQLESLEDAEIEGLWQDRLDHEQRPVAEEGHRLQALLRERLEPRR